MASKIRVWTPENIEVLTKYYPIEGSACCLRILRPDGTHVPRASVKIRANNMGLVCEGEGISKYRWTAEENRILREYYPSEGLKGTRKRLVGRSDDSIKTQVRRLGIYKNTEEVPWTEEEDDILRRFYPAVGEEAALLLDRRTRIVCIARARKLKIKAPASSGTWDKADNALLRNAYPFEGSVISKRMTEKTKVAVVVKANDSFLPILRKPWNDEEAEILFRNFTTLDEDITALLPGRSYKACRREYDKLMKIGYTPETGFPWTDIEVLLLKQYYPAEGMKVATRFTRHSEQSVMNKILELGLSREVKSIAVKSREYRKWTDAEMSALAYLIDVGRAYYATTLLKRSAVACAAKAEKLGLDTAGFIWRGAPALDIAQMEKDVVKKIQAILEA